MFSYAVLIFTPDFSHHHEQVARALIKNGANVNATEEDDYTALMFACQNGHEQV